MRKNLQGILMAIPLVVFLCSMSSFNDDGDTYWYVNGERYYWFFQPDVFAFRMIDGAEFSAKLDSNIVAHQFHRANYRDKMNIIYFKENSSKSQREQIKNLIRANHDFHSEFSVVTLFPELSYNSASWFVLDDLLLVSFRSDSLDQNKLQNFISKYNLQQFNLHDSISLEPDFTYIFKFDADSQNQYTAIELSKSIYENDSFLVKNVQPNLINAFQEFSETTLITTEFSGLENLEYYLFNHQNKTIQINVQLNNITPFARIKVYDLFGREVYSNGIDNDRKKLMISITDYVSGTYFACIENVKGEILGVQKFMKW